MKRVLFSFVPLLSLCSQLKAQPFQLGEVFDSRYENHTKGLKLFGRVKKLTETDSLRKMKYAKYKSGVEYVLTWTFNPDGNYNETAEYRGDGTLAIRDVFYYDDKRQMVKRVHFNGSKEESKYNCTIDAIHNVVRSEFYFLQLPQSFTTIEKSYNKQGKESERRLKYTSKPIEIDKFTYDAIGNHISSDIDGYKSIFKYDNKNFLIESLSYEKNGEIYMHHFYKNDQWGNVIEEKEVMDTPNKRTFNYIYDDHHNWIKKIGISSSDRLVTTRTIEYF
ncbi:MAG: hypothetical protein JWR50_2619 [Mucilaginibacter sp.]|nr:hypothetical protein [Mucilaginibacter sp.]